MPLVHRSTYKAPWYLFNGDVETIFSNLFRKNLDVLYKRERYELRDGDFVDLDWVKNGNRKLIVLLHGLEGNSYRNYMKMTARFMAENYWDILSFNCRSCSGEINRNFRLYHHGETEDLREVVYHLLTRNIYDAIVLIGFSMGGSQLIKFIGEEGKAIDERLKGGIAVSAPCDLKSSAMELARRGRKIYRKRFIERLKNKIRLKALQFPDKLPLKGLDEVRYFHELDLFTARLNGFKCADDFYSTASANNYIPNISVPLLLINAKNDPMLPKPCFPYKLAKESNYFFLETPEEGGHCGFYRVGENISWIERRCLQFIEEKMAADSL